MVTLESTDGSMQDGEVEEEPAPVPVRPKHALDGKFRSGGF